jgi:hypothetical protein
LEWKPLKTQIDARAAEARTQLDAFMRDRTWPDGWAILADLDRQAGDWEASRAHAELGLSQSLAQEGPSNPHRDRVRADAAWLLVHALNRLGRPGEGAAVLARLGRHPDLGGRTHFQLSRGALQEGDTARAQSLLSKAMALAQEQGAAIPAEFRFHEAAIFAARAEQLRDASDAASQRLRIEALEGAAASYTRALADAPEIWPSWCRPRRPSTWRPRARAASSYCSRSPTTPRRGSVCAWCSWRRRTIATPPMA